MKDILIAILVLFCSIVSAQNNASLGESSISSTLLELQPYEHIIYQINTRQYSAKGTFTEVTNDLKRLKKMGITTIMLMPIHPIGQKNKQGKLGDPYSVQDYMGVNSELGTAAELKQLIKSAHNLSMHVILDWVATKSASDHAWVTKNPEYYLRNERNDDDAAVTRKLDYANKQVQEAMIDAMKFWIDSFRVDGFKIDEADVVPLNFWLKARKAIDPTRTQLWIAACDNLQYFEAFDLQYAYKWRNLMLDFIKGQLDANTATKTTQYYTTQVDSGRYFIYYTSNYEENANERGADSLYRIHAKNFNELTCRMPGAYLIYNGQEAASEKKLQRYDKDTIQWGKYENTNTITENILTHNRSQPNTARMTYIATTDKSILLLDYSCHNNTTMFGITTSAEPVTIKYPKGNVLSVMHGLLEGAVLKPKFLNKLTL